METNTAPGGVQPAGDSTALVAEFGRWLGRERGLSLVSVQCYSKQSKAFLTWIGGARGGSRPDAGEGTAVLGGRAAGPHPGAGEAQGAALPGVLPCPPPPRPAGPPPARRES